MPATAEPTVRRHQALALVVALLAGLVVALGALPAAAAPNVAVITMSPASPTQADAVTLTVTIDGCAGQEPWNVYYIVEARPYYLPDRENARFNNGVLSNGGDTWTASATVPAFEAGAYEAYAYGVGPTCWTNGGQFLESNRIQFSVPQIATSVSGVAPATAVAGDTVQVAVAVNTTSASGPVTITENGSTWGSGTVSQGTATVNAGPLTAGTHDLVADFGGNRNYSGSTSAPMRIVVARAPSPLTVVATPSAPVRFQDVRVDVTAPTSAGGTFDVTEGGVVLSSGNPVVAGVGSTVLSDLAVGAHDLLVTYSGSTEHLPSTAPLSVNVARAASPLSVTATPSESVRFSSVRLDVSAPATADGSFDVSEGGIVLSSGNALVAGVGSTVVDDLAVGPHDLLVSYSGSIDHEPSTALVHADVTLAASPLTVVATPSEADRFEPVRVDVTAPATADGTFEVSEGGVVLSSSNPLVDGVGSTLLDDLAVGSHDLLITYSGSADHQSSSEIVRVEVARLAAPLTATAMPSSVLRGDGFDVLVEAPARAGGTFTVSEDGAVLSADNPLVDGSGQVRFDDLPAGVHELLVSYSGSTDFWPSTATTTVTVALRPTTTSLDVHRDGSQVTLTAEVAPDADWPASPEGKVDFTDGDVVIGTAELVDGVAELIVPSAAAGEHQLQAQYLGDDTTGPSESTVVTAIVPGMSIPATATAGEPLRVQATGFAPWSPVAVFLGGELISTLLADGDGAADADVMLPITASGRLVMTMRGEDALGDLVLMSQDIMVTAAPEPPVVTPPVAVPVVSPVLTPVYSPARSYTTPAAARFLARTGPTEPLTLVLFGLLSLLTGAVVVAHTRPGRRS